MILTTKKKEQATIKDSIVAAIAEKLQLSVEQVDAVVTHQFKEMIRAMASGCNSVEMSGFGVFHYLPNKAKRYKMHIEEDLEKIKTGKLHINTFKTLEGLTFDLEMIKNHLDNAGESKTNS